jgi:hypothetical protein
MYTLATYESLTEVRIFEISCSTQYIVMSYKSFLFPMGYELNFYIIFRRNAAFKSRVEAGLIPPPWTYEP